MDDAGMNHTNLEETKDIDVTGLAVAPSMAVRSVHLRDPVQIRKRETNQTEVSGRFLTVDDIAANKWKITWMHSDGMLLYGYSDIFAEFAIPCSNILIMEMAAVEFLETAIEAAQVAAPLEEGGPSEDPID